jgi:predicted AAA+ superfamily ATPase
MDVDVLKRVLLDQKKEMQDILQTSQLIPRELDAKSLLEAISIPNIIVILGIRRCGKSTFTLMHIQAIVTKFTYFDFTDERLTSFSTKDLNDIILVSEQLWGTQHLYVFDEIQNIEAWQLFVNRLRKTKSIICTGSNSNMLSGELATHLTGRYIAYTLFPFSFREYLMYKQIRFENQQQLTEFAYSTSGLAKILQHLDSYLTEGGFPEVISFGPRMAKQIYEDIIYKDIILRHRIRKVDVFRDFAQYLVGNFARPTTYASLSKTFQIKDKHTIAKYCRYLQESYLVVFVDRFSTKLKNTLRSPKIVYITDVGLLFSIKSRYDHERGRVMENVVAIELLRRTVNEERPPGIFYWKDENNHDVDFIILEDKKVIEIIQVCNVSEERLIPRRELDSFKYAARELRCERLTLITANLQGEIAIDKYKIRMIPLWKWLLRI